MSSTKLLRLPTICEICGLSKSTIYKLVAAGSFPAPVQIGVRAVAWDSTQIDLWIEQRLKAPRKLDRSSNGAVCA